MSEHREPETYTEPQDLSRTDVSLVTCSKNNSMVTPSASKPTPQDEYMSKMQQSMKEMLVQHPELASNPAFSLSTYAPGVDFVAACQEQLDAAGWERFSAAMDRYVGHGELPPTAGGSDIFDEVRTACQALLEGRADLQAQWDEVYGDRETWQRVRDVVGLAKRGEDVKGSV